MGEKVTMRVPIKRGEPTSGPRGPLLGRWANRPPIRPNRILFILLPPGEVERGIRGFRKATGLTTQRGPLPGRSIERRAKYRRYISVSGDWFFVFAVFDFPFSDS